MAESSTFIKGDKHPIVYSQFPLATEETWQRKCYQSQCALWVIATSNINTIIRIQNNSCPVTRLRSTCVLLFSSLQRCRLGEDGNDFRFRRFLLPFLCRQSLIPSMWFWCSPYFFYSFQVSFITISVGHHRFLFPPLSGHLLACLVFHILSI